MERLSAAAGMHGLKISGAGAINKDAFMASLRRAAEREGSPMPEGCGGCGRAQCADGSSLKPCGGCLRVRYCSTRWVCLPG